MFDHFNLPWALSPSPLERAGGEALNLLLGRGQGERLRSGKRY